ncbi:hypothetical protein [Halobaculum rarum]|uniref:hypothetical protein n=1 Tax=Halobaculum rarum TaxID=3075122 RepID=UPI0032AF51F5
MSSQDSDSRRGPKKSYRLSAGEREYLETGEAKGGYSKPKTEELVQQKVDSLPVRIQHLFEDVALLDESGRLDYESWSSGWYDLLGFPDEPTREQLDTGFTFQSPPSGASPTSKPTELGRNFGELVDHLLLAPGAVDRDQIRQDILWGVFSQLFIENRPSREILGEELPAYVPETIELLDRRSQSRKQRHDKFWADSDDADRWQDHKRAMEIRVVDLLRDGEVTVASTDVEHYRLAGRIVDWFIDSMVDGGTHGSAQQWAAFCGEYDSTEFDVASELTAQRVQSLLDDYRIVERIELKKQVQGDINDLSDQKWKSVPAQDVLLSIAGHETASSAEVSTDLDMENNQSGVTRIARDLAGVERDGGLIWKERPLLTGGTDRWTTTAYGDVIATRLMGDSIFLTEDLVPERVLIDALDELRS